MVAYIVCYARAYTYILVVYVMLDSSLSSYSHQNSLYDTTMNNILDRADDLSSQIRRTNHNNDTSNNTEKKKVVSLYRAQSLEYMYKARYCLLQALQFENDQDRERALEVAKSGCGSLDPLYSMIDKEEIEKRQMIFGVLFTGISNSGSISSDAKIKSSNDTDNNGDTGKVEEDATQAQESASSLTTECENDKSAPTTTTASNSEIDDRQQCIESRLAKLDSSILPKVPPPFISGSRSSGGHTDSQSRLEEIRRGLTSLGVTLPDNSRGKGDLISSDNLSPEEQVKLIIEQAKDEVHVEKSGSNNDGLIDQAEQYNDDDFIDENDSMFEGFEEDDDDYDIDALLSKAENLVSGIESAEVRQGGGSSEQQIRKTQAILLEARLCLEMIQSKSSESFLDNKAKKQDDDDKGNKTDVLTDKSSDDANSVDDDPGNKLAARKKARELIGKAQACLNNLMANWN